MILSFDFGGSKIAAALVDGGTGKIAGIKKLQISLSISGNECLDQIIDIGNNIIGQYPSDLIDAIGISFGGPVSTDGRTVIKSQHIKGWDNYPLADVIEEKFSIPVIVENDANAAAIGEWCYGAGKKNSPFVYLQMSTGIGSGIIFEGKIYNGQGLAGEIGHISLDRNGPLCKCGNQGCLESYSAGWALDSKAQKLLDESKGAKDLFGEYRKGNADAREIIRNSFWPLAHVLNSMICLLDPAIITLGGGITKARDVISEVLFPMVEQLSPLFLKNRTKIAFSHLEGYETLIGAAVLAKRIFTSGHS